MDFDEFKRNKKPNEIDPNLLISNNNRHDSFDNFFLTLALIYNDLKGLLVLHQALGIPDTGEATWYAGEMGGISAQINRLIASTSNEFIRYLHLKKEILKDERFKGFIESMGPKLRTRWKQIETVVNESKEEKSDFKKYLESIRHKVGYHYDKSGEELESGFIYHFYEKPQEVDNKSAYYGVGDNMPSTRFFYADAAAQGYLLREKIQMDRVVDFVGDMNHTIAALLESYINFKKKS